MYFIRFEWFPEYKLKLRHSRAYRSDRSEFFMWKLFFRWRLYFVPFVRRRPNADAQCRRYAARKKRIGNANARVEWMCYVIEILQQWVPSRDTFFNIIIYCLSGNHIDEYTQCIPAHIFRECETYPHMQALTQNLFHFVLELSSGGKCTAESNKQLLTCELETRSSKDGMSTINSHSNCGAVNWRQLSLFITFILLLFSHQISII